jgi:SAM-dependent methyltransferase
MAPLYARRVLARGRGDIRADAEWINPQPHERVLDLACGPATLALALAPRVRALYALDMAERMVAQARRAGRARRRTAIHLCVADAERLPLPANRFDLTMCRYSFANFSALQAIVNEMRRVTCPGGRVAVVEVVAPENPVQRQHLNCLERLRSHAPTRILSLPDLLALFAHSRLHMLDCHLFRRRQTLGDWLALSDNGQDRRARRLLEQAVLRLAGSKGSYWQLCKEGGRWCFYHAVARLLWRK